MEGLIGVVLGSIITYFIFRAERKDKLSLAEKDRRDKFRLVSIDKRLEAHQQALKYWELLRSVIHKSDDDEEKFKIIDESNKFWLDNSLYLERETRSKFKEAIWIVSYYKLWVDNYRDMDKGEKKEEEKKYFMQRWDDFHKLFEVIQKEVELEPIKAIEDNTPEGELIKKETKKKKQCHIS